MTDRWRMHAWDKSRKQPEGQVLETIVNSTYSVTFTGMHVADWDLHEQVGLMQLADPTGTVFQVAVAHPSHPYLCPSSTSQLLDVQVMLVATELDGATYKDPKRSLGLPAHLH